MPSGLEIETITLESTIGYTSRLSSGVLEKILVNYKIFQKSVCTVFCVRSNPEDVIAWDQSSKRHQVDSNASPLTVERSNCRHFVPH